MTAVIVSIFLLIGVFDLRSAPPSDSALWHAYLTEEELKHPLAKYWFNRAYPAPDVIDAITEGSLSEAEVLTWE